MKSEGEMLTENGDPGVTRTRNILLRRQVLYPVELRGRIVLCPLSSFPRRREPMNADIGDFPHAPCSWIPACARMTESAEIIGVGLNLHHADRKSTRLNSSH